MPAHPDLKAADANKIASWIMSLSKPQEKSLPAQGSVTPTAKEVEGGKTMQLSASYTDKGGPGRKPQTGYDAVYLSGPVLTPKSITDKQDLNIMEFSGRQFMMPTAASGWAAFDADLYGIRSMDVGFSGQGKISTGVVLEIFAESVNGKKIGEARISSMVAMQPNTVNIPVAAGSRTRRFILKITKETGESATVVVTDISLR